MRIINGELQAAYEQIAAAEEELRQNYDELNRKKQKLREREEKYFRIIDSADEGTCILDRKFQVNDRMADILDLEPHEIGARLITDFIHADDLPDQEHHVSFGRKGTGDRLSTGRSDLDLDPCLSETLLQ